MREQAAVASVLVFLLVPAAGSGADGDVVLSGFVDASYSGKPDSRENTFGLDQIEINVRRAVGGHGGVRADLEWVKSGQDWALSAEQGYLSYSPPPVPWATLTLGRFNAPIGFEGTDPNELYQFSFGLVSTPGMPADLTGAMLEFDLGSGFSLAAYIANGWEINHENNGVKTAGGRLGYSREGLVNAGVSAVRGSEVSDQSDTRTVVDVDVGLTPGERLVLGADLNHGRVKQSGQDRSWSGFLLMAHYDFTRVFGLTTRFDYLEDQDDFIFATGLGETRTAVTVAPTFVLGDGLTALFEFRVDSSNRDAFADKDGKADGRETSVACEMTSTF